MSDARSPTLRRPADCRRRASRRSTGQRIAADLDAHGCAVHRARCSRRTSARRSRALLRRATSRFRSRVVMARHGFGRGEYQYFAYPLPDAGRRAAHGALSARSPPIANRWNEAMGIDVRYPGRARGVPRRAATRPARRGRRRCCCNTAQGDYNCLHQDLYGEHVFPLQVAFLLSRAGTRLHRRRVRADRAAAAHAVARRGGAAQQGDAVIFAVHHRPVQGARHLPRQHAPRREPAALRRSAHARHHLPRREMSRRPNTASTPRPRSLSRRSRRADRGHATPARCCCAVSFGGEAPALLRAIERIAAAPVPPHDDARRLRHVGGDDQLRQGGLVTDRRGYRYARIDPLTEKPWPAMPKPFTDLAARAAAAAGFGGFAPDACLINRYEPGARRCIRTRTSATSREPIVSVSLGLAATFLFGGEKRAATGRSACGSSAATSWSGADLARMAFHGIDPVSQSVRFVDGRLSLQPDDAQGVVITRL